MKNSILKFSFIFLMPLVAFSKNPESVPDYNVVKTVIDSTLKKNESACEITFYASGNSIKKQNIQLSFNNVKKDIITDSKGNITLKLIPSKYKFQFFYSEYFFEITSDSIESKEGHKTFVSVFFNPSKLRVTAEKPVIYVYSKDTADVTLKLKTDGELTFTYPAYKDAWKVKSTPSGDLLVGKNTYPYLFWEGNIHLSQNIINPSEGFIVAKENLISFFEDKLNAMGLNAKEQTDFITYWCPRMSNNESSYVRFLFNKEVDKYATLNVNPKPDNLFRVFMIWTDAKKLDFSCDFVEQTILSTRRTGLTVIEWGGSELNKSLEQNN
ncbi:MAG: hypothetical protein IPG89_01160 [Bacteroidetes bacterium]|nr:hypothetical protein [Bacteroidota bacterium]